MKKLFSKKLLAILLAFGFLFGTAANAATFIVSQGGTGATTFSSDAILKGAGTSPIAASGISIDSSNNISGAVNIPLNSAIYTVGPTGSGARSITDGTADEVQINQAMTDCAAATTPKCYEVDLLPNTYIVADLVQIPSNIFLNGPGGFAATIVKAVANYAPASQTSCPQTGRCLVVAKGTTSMARGSNISVSGITFDGNGQNRDTGFSPNGDSMVLDIRYVDGFKFYNNKVFNGLNYDLFVVSSTGVWLDKNIIRNGWSGPGGLDQQDGIHTRCLQRFNITNNDIDTSDATNGGVSGDDGLVIGVGASQCSVDTAYGVVSGNNVSGGVNGIVLLQEGAQNTRDVVIGDNTIRGTNYSGIAFRYFGSSNYGQYQNITLDNNTITNWGLDTNVATSAIRAEYNTGSPVLAFSNVNISRTTARTSSNAAGNSYISWLLKGNGLSISGTTGVGLLNTPGIQIGNTSTPVKNYLLVNNEIDMSTTGSSNSICFFLFGTERGITAGNTCYGTTTGTGRGIYISGGSTAGNDASGVAKIETTQYNNVYGNELYNVDNGIEEVSPTDNNSFSSNHFNGITGSNYVMVGSASKVFGDNGTTFVANKTYTPFVNDGAALGTSLLSWSDGFFASGAVLNFNAGDVTETHGTNTLTFAGADAGYIFTSANASGTTTSSSLSLAGNSLTTGTGFYVASSTLTSGKLVDLQVSGTAAAASQTTLNILTAGANATNAITTYGAQISNTHTNATSGTNIGLYLNASGATTANYGLVVHAGNTGLGIDTPGALLDVNGTGWIRTALFTDALNGFSGIKVTFGSHYASAGTAPAVSSCGTSPSILATSTDTAGIVTVGSVSATTCTVTFANAYGTAPVCVVTDDTSIVALKAATTTTTLIFSGTVITSDVVSYICMETI